MIFVGKKKKQIQNLSSDINNQRTTTCLTLNHGEVDERDQNENDLMEHSNNNKPSKLALEIGKSTPSRRHSFNINEHGLSEYARKSEELRRFGHDPIRLVGKIDKSQINFRNRKVYPLLTYLKRFVVMSAFEWYAKKRGIPTVWSNGPKWQVGIELKRVKHGTANVANIRVLSSNGVVFESFLGLIS